MDTQFDIDRKIFLESFPGIKTFQTFKDNKDLKCSTNLIRQVSISGDVYPIGDFDFSKKIIDVNIIRGLEKLNDLGAGIYLTINETDGKGRKKENINRIRAIFGDFDGVPLPQTWENDPSLIVETSQGKYHVYWLTDDTPMEGFTQLQKAIAFKFKSDPVVHDLPRIMRVPGFWHKKGEPFMTRIISHTGLKYSFSLLNEMFPPEPVKQFSAPKYNKPVNGDDGEFKGSRGVSEPGRNCHIIKCLGGAKKRGLSWDAIEQEAYLEGAACIPPVKQSEVRSILKSFRRY